MSLKVVPIDSSLVVGPSQAELVRRELFWAGAREQPVRTYPEHWLGIVNDEVIAADPSQEVVLRRLKSLGFENLWEVDLRFTSCAEGVLIL